MGAPRPLAMAPVTAHAAAAPPPPPPDFFEAAGASFRTTKDDIAHVQRERLNEAYAPVIAALGERGDGGAWWFTNPAAIVNPFADPWDYDRVWRAMERVRADDPAAFADLPRTREEFERGVLTRQGERARDLQVAAQGGVLAGLAGGVPAMVFDPVNVATAPIGGGAKTLSQAVLREAVINMAIEGAQQAPLYFSRQRMGETLTGREAAANVAVAGVFGGLLGGVTKGAADNWDAIRAAPREVQERLWGAMLERVPALRERVGSTLDRPIASLLEDGLPDWPALDSHLPDIAESLIGRSNMGEAELGAVDVLRREGQVDAASPFLPNGAAAELHPRLLGEAMRGILDDVPEPSARLAHPRPLPQAGGELSRSTAISSRTVQFDAPDAQMGFMQRVRRQESRGDDGARNPRSSATGRYQFVDATWIAYYRRRFGEGLSDAQILARRGEGDLQDVLMRDLTADNAAFLRARGEAVSEGNLYLVHFAGQGGARRLFEAEPDAPVASVLGQAVVDANPHLRGMTAGDVIAWAHRAMGQPQARRGGAGATVREDVGEAGLRARLQEEIDRVTARIDALADERDAGGGQAHPQPLPRAGGETFAPVEPLPPIEGPEFHVRDAELRDDSPLLPDLRALAATPGRSLNRIDDIAAELGAGAEEVRRGLDQLVAEGRITRRGDTGAYMRKPPGGARGPDDVVRFVARMGGLSYDGLGQGRVLGASRDHDLRNTGSLDHFVPGVGPLLRPGGRSLDEVGEALHEAGYLGPPESTPRPTESEVIALLDDLIRSGEKRYIERAAPDEGAEFDGPPPDPEAEAAALHAQWALVDRVGDAAEARFATVLLPDDVAEIAALMRAGTDTLPPMEPRADLTDAELSPWIGEWLNRKIDDALDDAWLEAEDARYDLAGETGRGEAGGGGRAAEPGDAGEGAAGAGAAREAGADAYAEGERLAALPAEERAPFLDPESPAAKAQADSLEHDARAAVRPAGDQDVDPNIAARQAQEAALRAEAPLRSATEQESTLGLGLFGAADGVRLDPEGEARPIADLLDEFDAETAEIQAIRDCL